MYQNSMEKKMPFNVQFLIPPKIRTKIYFPPLLPSGGGYFWKNLHPWIFPHPSLIHFSPPSLHNHFRFTFLNKTSLFFWKKICSTPLLKNIFSLQFSRNVRIKSKKIVLWWNQELLVKILFKTDKRVIFKNIIMKFIPLKKKN